MKDHETKERFIELRAKGLSFEKIAKELQVSKQTLINWSKELEIEIANLKAIELDALQEKYFLTKKSKIELLGQYLEKVRAELEKRDLSKVKTDRLFDVLLKLVTALENEAIVTEFSKIEEFNSSAHVDFSTKKTWQA